MSKQNQRYSIAKLLAIYDYEMLILCLYDSGEREERGDLWRKFINR